MSVVPLNVKSTLSLICVLRPLRLSSNCTARLYVPSSSTTPVPMFDTTNGPAPLVPAAGTAASLIRQNTTLPAGFPPLVGFGNDAAKCPAVPLTAVGKSLSTGGEPCWYIPAFGFTPAPALVLICGVVTCGLATYLK